MTWRENLLPASIGGVPFEARSVKSSYGRRGQTIEFVGRDEPSSKDLGRRARRWSVEGFVLGDDYMAKRNALVEKLESPGPHVFVHPWRGEFSVVLEPGSALEIEETVDHGGYARISFSVVEEKDANKGQQLRVVPSSAAALTSAGAAVQAQAAADFAPDVTIDDVVAALTEAIDKVADILQDASEAAASALDPALDLNDAFIDLRSAAGALASTPASLMASLTGILGSLASTFQSTAALDAAPFPGGEKVLRAEAALKAVSDLAAVDLETQPEFPGDVVDADAQAAERALGRALRALSAGTLAQLWLELPLESADAAKQVVGTLGAAIDALLFDEGISDALYDSLTDLKVALDGHLAALARDLPTVGSYTPAATTPALLLAYALYGDPDRDLELVGRNRVADPNFVLGGTPLEVLVDGDG